MARDNAPNFEERGGEFTDFVPVAFARSLQEAEEYRQLLDDHDIPAIVDTEDHAAKHSGQSAQRQDFSHGVPVLVPEALLDEAGEVIAERDETDEFGLDKGDSDEPEEDEEEFGLGGTGPAPLGGEEEPDEEDEEDEEEEEEDDEDDDQEDDQEGEDLFEDDEDDEDDEGKKDVDGDENKP
jgi:hypothetical protein